VQLEVPVNWQRKCGDSPLVAPASPPAVLYESMLRLFFIHVGVTPNAAYFLQKAAIVLL
jgi:hypothetical protein